MLDAVIATGIACDPRHLDRPFVHLAAFHGPGSSAVGGQLCVERQRGQAGTMHFAQQSA